MRKFTIVTLVNAVATAILPITIRLEIKQLFLDLCQNLSFDFHAIIHEIDSQYKLIPGTAMQIFKSLILSHDINIDLNREINLNEPRMLFSFNV